VLRQYAGFRDMPGGTIRYRLYPFWHWLLPLGCVHPTRHSLAGFIDP
jgi:hypothetical protein